MVGFEYSPSKDATVQLIIFSYNIICYSLYNRGLLDKVPFLGAFLQLVSAVRYSYNEKGSCMLLNTFYWHSHVFLPISHLQFLEVFVIFILLCTTHLMLQHYSDLQMYYYYYYYYIIINAFMFLF